MNEGTDKFRRGLSDMTVAKGLRHHVPRTEGILNIASTPPPRPGSCFHAVTVILGGSLGLLDL